MTNKIPNHIVLFPDGNRRWAKQNGLKSLEGHKKGYENLLDFSDWCRNKGVKVLTAFGFSTENWNRSEEEVNYLMKLLEGCLVDNLGRYEKDGVRVRVIGQKERLPKSLQEAIIKVEDLTKNNSNLFLNLAISYGGKWDILNAVKNIVKEGISPGQITEEVMESHLSTAGLPSPDFIIRAGGEMRMSNFVLWQSAYAELYFSPKYWPEFTEQDLDIALTEFDKRTRRFGK
ncbi:MAG: polyprenyl diphosphate synthase [Candidatus Staskawiczbacteria bacterium]|nr:polyprenyl diphosphate synthase [Candidatus Staskawiczbacteria bacterium]